MIQFDSKLKINKKNYYIFKEQADQLDFNFVPPAFGITAIGASHGFDCQESTSGFIIWIDGKGVMIDPPPFTSFLLEKAGIPACLVDKLILTHCHADHDAGTLHKLIESSPVEFITTKTIMESFIRKFSAQCGIQSNELEQLFQRRQVKIGHKYNILGASFEFFYSFHSIPCLGFEISYQDKKIFYSGDTFFDPV